jgi:hypothetical protein
MCGKCLKEGVNLHPNPYSVSTARIVDVFVPQIYCTPVAIHAAIQYPTAVILKDKNLKDRSQK